MKFSERTHALNELGHPYWLPTVGWWAMPSVSGWSCGIYLRVFHFRLLVKWSWR